jgi:F-type H+-transporting ATPase subunit delta
VKSRGAAKPFAKALFALAKERHQAEAVSGELAGAAALVESDADLREFFGRPGVAASTKRGVADEIATRLGCSKLTRDFLGLVAGHGRGAELPLMRDAMRDLLDADLGRVRARVRTVVALTDAERQTLSARLGQALGGSHIVLEEVLDPNMLGGFVAESGSLVVDGSLDGQLARLKERLARG